jgi:hypothetical protein
LGGLTIAQVTFGGIGIVDFASKKVTAKDFWDGKTTDDGFRFLIVTTTEKQINNVQESFSVI